MPNSVALDPNPQGLGEVDVMGNPVYAARLRAYSDRLRRVTGHSPLRLWDLKEFGLGDEAVVRETARDRTPI